MALKLATGAGKTTVRETLLPADTDSDGLPDAWETAHSMNTYDPKDALLDPDGNGYSALEEWLNALIQ